MGGPAMPPAARISGVGTAAATAAMAAPLLPALEKNNFIINL